MLLKRAHFFTVYTYLTPSQGMNKSDATYSSIQTNRSKTGTEQNIYFCRFSNGSRGNVMKKNVIKVAPRKNTFVAVANLLAFPTILLAPER
jgi:hypothetical protein